MKFTVEISKTDTKDYFIKEAKIVNIEDISGQKLFGNNSEVSDVALAITFDYIENNKFENVVKIGGCYKRDINGKVESLGGVGQIKNFFNTIKVPMEIDSDRKDNISKELIDKSIGKRMYVLKYAYETDEDGKKKFSTWKSFGFNAKSLEKYFLQQVEKGYINGYIGNKKGTEDFAF